ncbi:MAG: hypothetical protein CSB33_05170 [Desulfobacterales bacterium]|nr:MAG: hypothetical protein CSB33_05170 [Desulfobacterales bacterium]
MLFLRFQLGDTPCALPCDLIREVVPMAALKTMDGTPDCFAGFFTFRGTVVPVMDLCRRIIGRECRQCLSTRIILLERFRNPADDVCAREGPSLFGLLAERVTETVHRSTDALDAAAVPMAVRLENAPFINGFFVEDDRMVQLLDTQALSSAMLFPGVFDHSGKGGSP